LLQINPKIRVTMSPRNATEPRARHKDNVSGFFMILSLEKERQISAGRNSGRPQLRRENLKELQKFGTEGKSPV
jgi:hypothetical protein